MEVIVSPKYQVLIPKVIRRQVNLRSGQKLQMIVKNGMITLVPDRPMKELRGFLKGMDRTIIRDDEERV